MKRYAFTPCYSYVPDKEWVQVWVIYFGFIAFKLCVAGSSKEFYAEMKRKGDKS